MSALKTLKSDILTIVCLLLGFFYLETTHPFYREFRLDDPRIQHPFAENERVTDGQLYLISSLIPMLAISVISQTQKNGNNKMYRGLVALWVSLSSAALITDVLKNWIGNPRPDFLARCGAAAGTPADKFVPVDVCTAPLGVLRITDGMKSTPSGHSSVGFAGLFFLTLWLWRQRIGGKWAPIAVLPTLLAAYIAFSRVQDYRHHFFDIFFGLTLGVALAFFCDWKYSLENGLTPPEEQGLPLTNLPQGP